MSYTVQTSPANTNSLLCFTERNLHNKCTVALDCEMVGTGSNGDFSMLARCSIVNHHGDILYDSRM